MPSILNHPSYNDKYRKVFPIPVKDGGLSILLHADKANKYEIFIRICEPLQNHSSIDAEFHRAKFFRKSENKNKNKLEQKRLQSKI